MALVSGMDRTGWSNIGPYVSVVQCGFYYYTCIPQVKGDVAELSPELEVELKVVVDSIIDPSGIPGSRYMEEVTVKLCSLIKAQKATADPALLTENMQVQTLELFIILIL